MAMLIFYFFIFLTIYGIGGAVKLRTSLMETFSVVLLRK